MAENSKRPIPELLDSESTVEREFAQAILLIVEGVSRLAELYGAQGEWAQNLTSLKRLCGLRNGDGEAA